MRLKQTSLRLAGAAMIAAAVVPWLGGSTAAADAPPSFNATVKQDQVPTTAADFGNKQTDCPNWAVGDPEDSFHFVTDGGFTFVSLTVEFSTGTVTITTFADAKHAYVEAPAGATLVNAWATLDPPPDPGTPAADFQLSHVCVGTPSTTSSSPPPTTTSAPVTTSAPPTTTSAPPTTSSAPVTSATSVAATTASQAVSVLPTKVENTTAEASPETSVLGEAESLPHTGGGVPYLALAVISLGLLLAGGALMFLPGLSVERANRRH